MTASTAALARVAAARIAAGLPEATAARMLASSRSACSAKP
jgi:hypothetical protein